MSAQPFNKGAGARAGHVTDMNALPVKNGPSLGELVDELIANFGGRRVFLAIARRLLKRTRPPDPTGLALRDQPGVELLDDRVRADIGLPPKRKGPDLDILAGYSSRHWL